MTIILKGRGVKHTKRQPIWLVNNVQLKSAIRYFIASYHFQHSLILHFFLSCPKSVQSRCLDFSMALVCSSRHFSPEVSLMSMILQKVLNVITDFTYLR